VPYIRTGKELRERLNNAGGTATIGGGGAGLRPQ
jgi:hypothetical protein